MLSKTFVGSLVVAAVVAGGCGDSKSDKAMADVCGARDDMSKQVDQLAGLTITTATTSQVSDGLEAIRNDLTKISDARKDLSDERRTQVDNANDEFASAVRTTLADVGTSVSLASAAAEIKAAFGQLKTSYESTFAKLDCP
jgi:hypothetical protein